MNTLQIDLAGLRHIPGGIRDEVVRVPFDHTLTIAVPEHYALEKLCYVGNPIDPERQIVSIYIPPAYLQGKTVGGFTVATAPVLLHVEGGGFKWQHVIDLHENLRTYMALRQGFVVVCPSFRGPNDHYIDIDGDGEPEYTGISPAGLVDLKAVIRFLRHNRDVLPGNYDRIFAAGCSSGGAMSALLAASGNAPQFREALDTIGAAEERDDIFACGDYFGPTALGICDMSYDWLFGRGIWEETVYEQEMPMGPPRRIVCAAENENGPVFVEAVKAGGSPYDSYTVYGRQFVDEHLKPLGLTEAEYVSKLMGYLLPAYNTYRILRPEDCGGHYFYFETYQDYLEAGYEPDPYYDETLYPACGGYISFNLFRAFISKNAYKGSPSFDLLKKEEMYMSENALFGDCKAGIAQFTDYGAAHGELATGALSPEIRRKVQEQDPFFYIGSESYDHAPHWYLMHGTADGDIPLTLTMELHELLREKGLDSEFSVKFNVGHGGDDAPEEVQRFLTWALRILREEVR